MTRLEIERAFREASLRKRTQAMRDFCENASTDVGVLASIRRAFFAQHARHMHVIGMTPAVDEAAYARRQMFLQKRSLGLTQRVLRVFGGKKGGGECYS